MSESTFPEELRTIARHVAGFYQRGWSLGTGGNYSAVLSRDPLRLGITASGVDKGELGESDFVVLDAEGARVSGVGKPSAETGIHLALVEDPAIGSVYHTHSVWGSILSRLHGDEGGFWITGLEMLKGLEGVKTHEHREWVPVIENSQDIPQLAAEIRMIREEQPLLHGLYLRGHGLYTWGATVREARRHVEIYEYLFEVLGRELTLTDYPRPF